MSEYRPALRRRSLWCVWGFPAVGRQEVVTFAAMTPEMTAALITVTSCPTRLASAGSATCLSAVLSSRRERPVSASEETEAAVSIDEVEQDK